MALFSATLPAQESPLARYQILTLHSADQFLPSFVAIDRATRKEIQARLGARAGFLVEPLDMLRNPTSQFEPEMLALLRKKYGDRKIDVEVSTGMLALAERYGHELWPGAPIVFQVVPMDAVRGRALGPRTTGVPVAYEVAGTIDLALRLRPATRRVVGGGGTSDYDRKRLQMLLAKQEMARGPLDLNAAIIEVLRLLEAEARRRTVELASELDDAIPSVLGDRVHLQQVLLNLVINALDAMADTPAHLRRVVVRTSRSAQGVEVAVTDRGHGIAPDRLPRLFESFYTTKQTGMGLGLSIARSIVEAHGGEDLGRRR